MFEIAKIKRICSSAKTYVANEYSSKNVHIFHSNNSSAESYAHTSVQSPESTHDEPLEMTRILCEKYDLMNEEFSYNAQRLFYVKHFYPIILFFGIVSNIWSFVIMIKIYKQKKNAKFALSLSILSLADLAVLLFGCLSDYTELVLSYSLRSSSIYACKFMFYCCYSFSCYSAYMHAWISFDRFKAIVDPIKSNSLKSKRKRKTLCFIFVFSLIISVPFIYFANLNEVLTVVFISGENFINFKDQCDLFQNSFALGLAQALIDLVLYEFAPLLLIIIFSCISIKQLIANKSLFGLVKIKTESSVRKPSNVQLDSGFRMNSRRSTVTSSNVRTSIMLSIIPLSYAALKIPIFIIILLKLKNNFLEKENSKNVFAQEYEIAKTLMFANYSINILYYIILGKNYRDQFVGMLKCKKRKMRNNTEVFL